MFTRYDLAAAACLLSRFHGFAAPSKAMQELTTVNAHGYRDTLGDEIAELESLSDEELCCFFAMLAKRGGNDVAADLANKWSRVADPRGVTIHCDQSDSDPWAITVHIQEEGDIVDAWCDRHGALAGGTWESADGPDFAYDILYWSPSLMSDLAAFDIDWSNVSHPLESFSDESEIVAWAEEQGFDDADGIAAGIIADWRAFNAADVAS